MGRRYRSEVRERQKDVTREAIVTAAAGLLSKPVPDVQIPDVARAADVSPATVYRHFASKDDLLDAVYERWMARARDVIARTPDDRESMLQSLGELWAAQSADEDLERAMSFDHPVGRAIRRRRLPGRRAAAARLVEDVDLPDDVARRRLEATVLLLTSTAAHRHLREHWGMSTVEAADVAAWAVRALIRGAV